MMTAPARFVKQPIEVEAMQYIPPSDTDPQNGGNVGHPQRWDLIVTTPEDGNEFGTKVDHIASPGDWLIAGVAGEFYPCKPGIFNETYRPVATS